MGEKRKTLAQTRHSCGSLFSSSCSQLCLLAALNILPELGFNLGATQQKTTIPLVSWGGKITRKHEATLIASKIKVYQNSVYIKNTLSSCLLSL